MGEGDGLRTGADALWAPVGINGQYTVMRDTKNAKTGQRKHEKAIFRILCVKPPKSGGFLSMI